MSEYLRTGTSIGNALRQRFAEALQNTAFEGARNDWAGKAGKGKGGKSDEVTFAYKVTLWFSYHAVLLLSLLESVLVRGPKRGRGAEAMAGAVDQGLLILQELAGGVPPVRRLPGSRNGFFRYGTPPSQMAR